MQKRAVETRNKILAAAVELFAAGGMKGTGVDLIAASAGVNKQRIYAYTLVYRITSNAYFSIVSGAKEE